MSGSSQARTSTFKPAGSNDTKVTEPDFSFTLPGPWKLSAQDWDARYHSYQWTSSDKRNNGRLFRVYENTIPADQAVNYLLPVTVENNAMVFGTVSGNCVDFTEGATPQSQRPTDIPLDKAALPSRWGSVDFLCDNGYVANQVVGAASSEAINTITLSGSKSGKRKFFFMYQDNNITPDFGQFQTILSTFKVN